MLPFLALPRSSLSNRVSATQLDALTTGLSHLEVDDEESVDGTAKRKVDGTLAATRLGQSTSHRWANERFRQTMLLILEFRREWAGNSLLNLDDVDAIRTAIDNALAFAITEEHKGDIYDSNPTCWAIWLVQRAHSLKAGNWTVESVEAQQRLTFRNLYEWLKAQHSLRRRHDLRDAVSKKVVHRYVLPFKHFNVPPPANLLFKYRKSAQRLSDWIVRGSASQATGLAAGIIAMAPAALVAPPPGQAAREARASAAWDRVRGAAQRRSRLPLISVQGDSEDAQETRVVVSAVMQAAEAGGSSDDSDDEMAAQLEREMEEEQEEQSEGPSERGGDDEAGPLNDYEAQRAENIRRNNERLQALGLLDGPMAPASRPTTAPRQPRPPRAPTEPSRGSERQRGKERKSYSEAQADRDLEALLATYSEDDGASDEQGGEPTLRRSTRVPGGEGSDAVPFSELPPAIKGILRAIIKDRLSGPSDTSDLDGAGLEIVHFMSATQAPRDRINSVGISGDADELDRNPESLNISISLRIRNFFSRVLRYSQQQLWRWLAWLPGLDVTALLYRGEVIGATVGFYWEEEHVYLTHLTAVHRELQGAGVGLFLRRWQVDQLTQRIGLGPEPLEVVSLSESIHGAVEFQRRVLNALGFNEVSRAEPLIHRLAAVHPELELERVLSQQGVTPLRFRQSVSLQ